MRFLWILLPIAILVGCSSVSGTDDPPNRWSDERLWAVLNAQEHRDVDRLCALLADTSAVVREAVALAFASVQDSSSLPCLLKALDDKVPSVRATAVFALGFVADSVTVQYIAERALDERDSTVQRAYLTASFLAMQRNGMLNDPNAILYYLQSARGHERVRAADALRRLPDSLVQKAQSEIEALMSSEGEELRPFLILAIRKLGARADRVLIASIARDTTRSLPERISAIRAWARLGTDDDPKLLPDLLMDAAPMVSRAALDELRSLPCPMPKAALAAVSLKTSDVHLSLSIEALAKRCGQVLQDHFTSARIGLGDQNPYQIAEHSDPEPEYLPEALKRLSGSEHPAIKQSLLQWAIRTVREQMTRSRYASRKAQYARLGEVVAAAIGTGDAGLISSIGELLQEEDPEAIKLLLPPTLEKTALAPLHPIRDLETRILLAKAIAKRDGLPYRPPFSDQNGRVPFNHRIDKTKALELKQGQKYRITTNDGEIILSTDVNECPGSSLAFDSLVTAGYYNGKYFHRVVPNFVVQGGCPRGDGYGGMPWTLRTEIGRTPFVAGSVGLASAGPDTESCQFFITHSAAPHLDGRYTRFGQVESGMDVVWQLQVGDRMISVERLD